MILHSRFDLPFTISGICRLFNISGSIVSFNLFTTASTSAVSTNTHCTLSGSIDHVGLYNISHLPNKSSAPAWSITVLESI
ncbi:MAG: hypothetical protein Q8S84_03790 [bacterium]|nr:hypothetical protein [bacterium]MDP3380643.1 hypothetical protein [bacterium]